MVKNLLSKIDQNAEKYMLLVFYNIIIITVGMEVFRRFILGYSSAYGEELARYSFIYLVWIGASLAVKDRHHIRIDIIYQHLSEKGRKYLDIIAHGATLGFAVLAFYSSLHPLTNAIHYNVLSEGIQFNKGVFLLAIPLGFGLLSYRVLQVMTQDIKLLRDLN